MKNKTYFILSLLVCCKGYAQQEVGPIDFSGGLNIASLSTLIPDQDSPDLCNCAPSLQGAMLKRNGSQRFIAQAISSNPVTSLYQAYSSTSNGITFKALMASSGDKIIVSTKSVNHSWVVVSSNNAPNQHYNYVTMGGKILIAGDALAENVRQFDIANSTQLILRDAFVMDAATTGIIPRGKYQLVAKNYYILANVQVSSDSRHLIHLSTYYPSRLVWSSLNNFSSMTAKRFIDFKADNGEEITGLGSLYSGSDGTVVNIFKPSAIGELSFNVLDVPSQGGDFQFQEIVTGFGVLAPRTLVNTGQFYVFLAKDGVRIWDGGRRSRLAITDESRIISDKIKPLIDDLIRSGNYKNAVGIYYPKRQWYVLSFEHPTKFPKGRNNHVLVYDFITGQWWPFCGWQMDSFTLADNAGDTGQLYGGLSIDGLVNLLDVETAADDARHENSIDVMDSTFTWTGSSMSIVDVREGTASLKISIHSNTNGQTSPAVTSTSMTRTGIFQFGEWQDRSRVSVNDKIAFKAFAHNVTSITSLRLDFEVKQTTANGLFDTNFTSVTLSSSAFPGNRVWTTFEIPLSSFPIRADWTDLSIESVPFANRFNAYGIRFVISGVNISSVIVDDLRIVGGQDKPLSMYRFSKLWDFKTMSTKSNGAIFITMEKAPEAAFSFDVYNDFGQRLRTEKFEAETPREIILFRPYNAPGLAVLDSVTFNLKRATATVAGHWDCLTGEADNKQIVCGDRTDKNRLIAFNRLDLSTFSMVFGSSGTGAGNFNLIHEIRQIPDGYVIADLINQRTKIHAYKNFAFQKMHGELGSGTTNQHQVTGVCGDGVNIFASDEGNARLFKVTQSTFGFIGQVLIDHNAIADSSLVCDDKYVHMLYNRFSSEVDDTTELILDKRDKGNLDLVTRAVIKPNRVSTGSFVSQGSLGLLGRYIYIPFSSDIGGLANPVYYVQKRLTSNYDIVSQYETDQRFFSVAGYGKSFNPITKTTFKGIKTEGKYIQLKYYDDPVNDNYWRLYNQTFLMHVQPLTYPN